MSEDNYYQKVRNSFLNRRWVAIPALLAALIWLVTQFSKDVIGLYSSLSSGNKKEKSGQVLAEEIRPLYFHVNSDSLIDESRDRLKGYAKILSDLNFKQIIIEGHIRELQPNYNIPLNANRARAVKAFLVHYGLDPQKLVSVGFGAERPLRDTNSPYNDRVELRIVW